MLVEPWHEQIDNYHDKKILNGMYMLNFVKHILFNIYKCYIYVLAFNFYLVNVFFAEFYLKIDEI